MCWSGEASAVLATVGLSSTAYVAYKGEKKELWIPLGYFSLMELLQAVTYMVIDDCSYWVNQLLTMLGVLHIAFQPLFINMVSMHFIRRDVADRISASVYGISLLGTGLMFLKIYPFEWAGQCIVGFEPLCANRLCSVHGNWHIAWEVPLNGIQYIALAYYIPAFVLPIIYGAWRFTLYHILVGPALAALTTNNINEWPAVWCLFSIALLLVVIKTPIRRYLYQNQWLLWNKAING